jgi:hypothetical protein
MNATPKTIDEFLEAADLAQGSVPIVMKASLLAEIEQLERRIEQIQNADVDDERLAGNPEGDAADLADRIRALEAEANEWTLDLRLTAVPRKRWTTAVAKYTTQNDDGAEKLDLDGLMEDLFPDSLTSPEMTEVQRTEFLTKRSEGQWEKIINKLWDLNRGGITVGKSERASMVRRTKSEKPGPDAQ